jgi:hypothetical protein
MSAQLEDVTEQLSFEGMPLQAFRLSASISDMDCRYKDEPLILRHGDKVTIQAEVEMVDLHVPWKRKQMVDGDGRSTRSVGIGPMTRKHIMELVPGTAIITNVERRESEEDRVRRMTR